MLKDVEGCWCPWAVSTKSEAPAACEPHKQKKTTGWLDAPLCFVARQQTLNIFKTSKTESLGKFESSILSELQNSKGKHGRRRIFAYVPLHSFKLAGTHDFYANNGARWCKSKTVAVLDVAFIMNHYSNHGVAIFVGMTNAPGRHACLHRTVVCLSVHMYLYSWNTLCYLVIHD